MCIANSKWRSLFSYTFRYITSYAPLCRTHLSWTEGKSWGLRCFYAALRLRSDKFIYRTWLVSSVKSCLLSNRMDEYSTVNLNLNEFFGLLPDRYKSTINRHACPHHVRSAYRTNILLSVMFTSKIHKIFFPNLGNGIEDESGRRLIKSIQSTSVYIFSTIFHILKTKFDLFFM